MGLRGGGSHRAGQRLSLRDSPGTLVEAHDGTDDKSVGASPSGQTVEVWWGMMCPGKNRDACYLSGSEFTAIQLEYAKPKWYCPRPTAGGNASHRSMTA